MDIKELRVLLEDSGVPSTEYILPPDEQSFSDEFLRIRIKPDDVYEICTFASGDFRNYYASRSEHEICLEFLRRGAYKRRYPKIAEATRFISNNKQAFNPLAEKREVNLLGAHYLLEQIHQDYEFKKSGYLCEGEYIIWGRRKGCDAYTERFGVIKSTGEIECDPRWSSLKPHINVGAFSDEDIRQIEEEVIATGLCRRDVYGRVVTNSGDCYLTLEDGNSVWIPIIPADDYDDSVGFPSFKQHAIRPAVMVYPHRVGDGKGEYIKRYWMIMTEGGDESWIRLHNPKNNPLDRNFPPDEQLPEWAFCIVGNVVDEHLFGAEKKVVRGSKHFRPGAKLYILDGFWGMGGEYLIVMGQPRNKRTLIKIVFKRSLIKNFRVKQAYDRRVVRELYLPFGDADLQTSELRIKLDNRAGYWNEAAEAEETRVREFINKNHATGIVYSERAEWQDSPPL